MLLAIDTSTLTIGAAVCDARGVRGQATESGARAHAELLAPTIERALSSAGLTPAGLTCIVVGVGPGPFTGLRVGIVTATVMAHTLGLPVHGVCSLDAIAAEVADSHRASVGVGGQFLVATDARRKEVYWAQYRLSVDAGGFSRSRGPAVSKAGDVPTDLRELPAFGQGRLLYPQALTGPPGPTDVDPGQLGLLGLRALAQPQGLGARVLGDVVPLYLRRPDAAVTPAAQPAQTS